MEMEGKEAWPSLAHTFARTMWGAEKGWAFCRGGAIKMSKDLLLPPPPRIGLSQACRPKGECVRVAEGLEAKPLGHPHSLQHHPGPP